MTTVQNTQLMTWSKRFALCVLGALLALGQAPFGLSFVYFLILPFIGWIIREIPTPKVGFGVGWWFALGYFTLTLCWIVEPFFVEPQITGWMAPFALFFMAGGLALFWAGAFALSVWSMSAPIPRLVSLAVFWTFFEFLRAHIFTGFPWGHLSYGMLDLPIAQLFSYFGIHGTGLLILLICFLPAIFSPKIWDGAFWMAVILSVVALIGIWRVPAVIPDNKAKTVVRLVQPNAAQHLKWRSDMVSVFFGRQLGYTAAKTFVRPDVVIWPETSIPYILDDTLPAIQDIATASGPTTSVIAGIVRRQGNNPLNSLLYIDPVGGVNAVFDKQHLVPFGEYMPFAAILDRIGLSYLTGLAGRFEAGTGNRVQAGHSIPDFIALICYEAIFPAYSAYGDTRPEWIVHITNDAWFGEFSGPYQHLAQARVRAIEQGLPVARSANTGISALIDPYGGIVQSLGLGQAGYLDETLPAALPKTLYGKTGEWLWIVFALLILLGVAFAGKSQRTDKVELD